MKLDVNHTFFFTLVISVIFSSNCSCITLTAIILKAFLFNLFLNKKIKNSKNQAKFKNVPSFNLLASFYIQYSKFPDPGGLSW